MGRRKKKKVLITGADGFIGKRLANFLTHKGHDVYGTGRSKTLAVCNYFQMRTLTLSVLKKMFSSVDCIIHLSAVTAHDAIAADPVSALKYDIFNVLTLAEFYVHSNATCFIYPSSGKVYGKPCYLPVDESHPANPVTYLGQYKKISEEILHYFHRLSNKPFVILRLLNVYGPGQKKNFLIPEIMRQLKDGNTVSVGNLNSKRDYLFIDDALNAFELALSRKLDGYTVLNVGSGESYSIKEILRFMEEILRRKLMVRDDKAQARRQEAGEERADISRVSSLGWRPSVELRRGLEITLRASGELT